MDFGLFQRTAWRVGVDPMSNYVLTSPREADELIARLFSRDLRCNVRVREDKAFHEDGSWLSLGTIEIAGSPQGSDQLIGAVRRGAFEWKAPSPDDTRKQVAKLLQLPDNDKSAPKLRRTLDAIAAISVRTGLRYPRFDPHALESMPFRKSTTVVADTSGVIQGGLDFVARYLHPAARVKVPAIVQMEIVNFAERFLAGRRAAKPRRADLLIDHLMSQGGQRVLLRLELQGETEIERTYLLGDPLRSAFQTERDPDLSDLNLSVPIRAYVDRLVLEAARQHQAQANLGHKVQLLTGDQGLARMAMSEGILPLFFSAVSAHDFFGRTFTGATLDPFTGKLQEISISSVIWELATAFGKAQLESTDGSHSFTVCAIGEQLTWSPYHSRSDLLWCDHTGLHSLDKASPAPDPERHQETSSQKEAPFASRETPKPTRDSIDNDALPRTSRGRLLSQIALQRFHVGRLLMLADLIDSNQTVKEEQVMSALETRSKETLDEYRRFLVSGDLLRVQHGMWFVTPSLQALAIALRNEDIERIRGTLLSIPSFAWFHESISDTGIGHTWDSRKFGRAANTYKTLGEITLICAPIVGEGVYPTPSQPDAETFAPIALRRFRDLDQGDGLVATGAWLEQLIRKDGIHPEVARVRLSDASARSLVTRSTEGSTTEVRFDNHTIQVLRLTNGKPTVLPVHLYRGDYLIPGKSSTSIRIEEPRS